MTYPLAGFRVLDLTRLLPGATCTLMLVDLGADVIKVEAPDGGDFTRQLPPLIDGLGALFRASNRGKRSVAIDLKDEEGQAILTRLAQSADVLVESFRPGVTARLGCDYARLQACNPRLVYCSLSGWGADGPYALRSGHDLNYIARTGILGATENAQPPGAQVADVGGAYIAVAGILAALLRRERTGSGSYIDTSLAEAALPFALIKWVEAVTSARPSEKGMLSGGLACYRTYLSQDNIPVTLAALEAKFWANFCQAIGRADLIAAHTVPDQQKHLIDELEGIFATRTAAEWEALLADADCCLAVAITPGDVHDDPHHQARNMMGLFADGTPWMRSPVRLNGNSPLPENNPPGYGEHTREVLLEAGYTPEEIALLAQQGGIRLR